MQLQSTRMARVIGGTEDPRVRLRALFGGALPSRGQPAQPAVVWAHEVLSRGGFSNSGEVVTKVRELRKADRRLTLKSATFLAHHVGPGQQ